MGKSTINRLNSPFQWQTVNVYQRLMVYQRAMNNGLPEASVRDDHLFLTSPIDNYILFFVFPFYYHYITNTNGNTNIMYIHLL